MMARRRPRVLPFQTADSWARRGAEARLLELLAEAREIEEWLSEARVQQKKWTVAIAGGASNLALVKR